MSDLPPKRRLSEISHLFLSDLRDGSGQPRPQRIPPKANQHQEPITPPVGPDQVVSGAATGDPTAVVSAVLVAHLNGRTDVVVREYAASLSRDGSRIGVATVGPRMINLAVVEPGNVGTSTSGDRPTTVDSRALGEAMIEMDADVDRWLIVLPDTRTAGPQRVLEAARHWTLLSTDDHDGIVGAYRTLKGVASELRPHRLQVAVMEGRNPDQARGSITKLKQVVEQFLGWEVTAEAPAKASPLAACRVILSGRPSEKDEAYDTLASFLEASRDIDLTAPLKLKEMPPVPADLEACADPLNMLEPEEMQLLDLTEELSKPIVEAPRRTPRPVHRKEIPAAEVSAPVTPVAAPVEPAPARPEPVAVPPEPLMAVPAPVAVVPAPVAAVPAATASADDEVIELSAGMTLVTAVLAQRKDLVVTPVSLPDWPTAVLAVNRSGMLTVLAGVENAADLARAVAVKAWLSAHRTLLSMALPQFTLAMGSDIQLLIDARSDLAACPAGEGMTILRYRRLTWGGRSGVVLV